jgi:SP family arabinose:H+ symporter-like MFS transporter
MALNTYLIRSTIVGALGGLLFGFDTAVISGTTRQLTQVYGLTPHTLGVTVGIALLGTILGAATSGVIGQRIGGRETLRIMALLYVISALGCAFAWSWETLLIARFIGGIGIGGSSVLGPVYIAEIAPAKWRGRLVGMFQINIVVGILLAYFSNYVIRGYFAGHPAAAADAWRWQLGVAGIPAALFLALLFGIPRSSRWLVTRNRIAEARQVLELIGTPDTEAELKEIQDSVHFEKSALHERLFQPKYLVPIYLAVTIALFNQLSGINAILYYANDIFTAAGFSQTKGDLGAVLVGFVNLIFTLGAMAVIDKIGRKTLLLVGAVGMAICLAGTGTIYLKHTHQAWLLWTLMGFIAMFAISQGAVVWVYISEIFPNRIRAKGQSLGSMSHWVMNAIITFSFPSVVAAVGDAVPFYFFAAMMVLQFVLVLWLYPETKGLSLEELQRKLKIA